MYLSKQELKSVPFQLLNEEVSAAGKLAIDSELRVSKEAYERMMVRKEKQFAETHEAPDEGALREEFPFIEPDIVALAKTKKDAETIAHEEFLSKHKFISKASWLLPQITAYIATLNITKNEKGLYDPLKFLQDNFTDSWHMGLYRYCTTAKRGSILKDQAKELGTPYCALVPLLLMPFKKMNNIHYSSWDRDHLAKVLDPALGMAISCTTNPKLFSTDTILASRDNGLLIKSGAKAGERRNPISSWKIFGHLDDDIAELPWLSQVMLHQIWCAHPSVRNKYMILDWINLDDVPEPLISTEVMSTTPNPKKITVNNLTSPYPWEL